METLEPQENQQILDREKQELVLRRNFNRLRIIVEDLSSFPFSPRNQTYQDMVNFFTHSALPSIKDYATSLGINLDDPEKPQETRKYP